MLEIDVDDWAIRVVRLAAAWALALLAGLALTPHVPGSLPTTSDVAGYPTAFGFEVLRYRNVYGLWVIGVPLFALVAHRALLRVPWRPTSCAARTTIGVVPARQDDVPRFTRASSAGRAALLGLLGGLQVSIVSARWGWNPSILTALGVVVVACAGWAATDKRASPATSGRLHLGLATLGIFGMYGVSRSVWALVGPDGGRVAYPVLPFALVALVALSFAGIATRLAGRHDSGWSVLEKRIAWYVTPVLLLLTVIPRLPGAVAGPDLFHDGEQLGGAQFLMDGRMPWRDFISIHGLLYDSLYPLLGMKLIDPSHWGNKAGASLIITPVYVAALYVLVAVLLRRNWLLLATCFVLLVLGTTGGYLFFIPVHDRLVLVFPTLVAMIWFLRSPRLVPAILFMLLLFSQTILTPESAYMVPAAGIVVVLADLQSRSAIGGLRTRFPRTLLFLGTGLVATVAFAVVLVAVGALDDYVEVITTFASDHALTGGLPIAWGGFMFAVAAYTPPIAIVCMFSLCWVTKQRGKLLSANDLAMLTLALFLLPYYTKFLYRADGHVYQPFAMSLPLVAYLVYWAIEGIDRAAVSAGLRRLGGIRAQTVLAIPIAIGALFPWAPALRAIEAEISDAATSIEPEVGSVSLDPKLGYSASTLDQDVLPDLQHVLEDSAGRPLSVFDFTNSPALYSYLLDVDATTRFFHVSMAIREKTQGTLIDELETDPPDVVILQSSLTGSLPAWDALPNIVRHYDVSEWILRNYRPWLTLHTQVIYQRAELSLPVWNAAQLGLVGEPSVPDPMTDIAECTFHQLGERIPVDRAVTWEDVPTVHADEMVTISGWAGRPGEQTANVIVLVGDTVAAITRPATPDPSVSANLGLAPEALVMFNVTVPSVQASSGQLWVAATFPDGTITAVTQPPATVLQDRGETLTLADGSEYRWAPGSTGDASLASVPAAADGTVTLADGSQASIERVLLPADAADNSWLSISSGTSLVADSFLLADRLDDQRRFITFDSLGDASVEVQVGACPQWHARQTGWMYLVHHQPTSNPLTIRLGSTGA